MKKFFVTLMFFTVSGSNMVYAQTSNEETQKVESQEELAAENVLLKAKVLELENKLKSCVKPKQGQASIVSSSPASTQPLQGGWAKSKWGDSTKELQKTYGKSLNKTNSNMYLKSYKVMSYDGILIFQMTKSDKLAGIVWMRNQKRSHNNKELDRFFEISEALTKKYGEPINDFIWHDELYADDKSKWEFAISLGHLSLRSTWKTNNELIVLNMDGEKFQTDLKLSYISNVLLDELQKDLAKETEDQF